jgi:hypothetical protein
MYGTVAQVLDKMRLWKSHPFGFYPDLVGKNAGWASICFVTVGKGFNSAVSHSYT